MESCPPPMQGLFRHRFQRLLIVLAGIALGQAVVYGPSLIGQKILLPLDVLALPNVYLPTAPNTEPIVAHDQFLSDLINVEEISRRFAVAEIHAGRVPLWAPYQFAGVPFVWPKYSPLLFLKFCTASPVILAWSQMLAAVVAGFGAYCFARGVLQVGFSPAAVVAWCYPLTGFFVFWQGYPTSPPVVWLPWLLLIVHKTVREPGNLAAAVLSVVTALVLTSGALDVAGQVLLASGLFAVWGLLDLGWLDRLAEHASAIGGVRPSSGAATFAPGKGSEKSKAPRLSHAAAPEDGPPP